VLLIDFGVLLFLLQLAKQKAAEIESLLQRLSDVNHDMSSVIAGAADSRSHTLARHRDILQDLTQVCVTLCGVWCKGVPCNA
jgi:hypothetical protein